MSPPRVDPPPCADAVRNWSLETALSQQHCNVEENGLCGEFPRFIVVFLEVTRDYLLRVIKLLDLSRQRKYGGQYSQAVTHTIKNWARCYLTL